MAKKKYYVVWEGRRKGVFEDWDECRRSTEGFAGARYKSFDSKPAAESAFRDNPWKHLKNKTAPSKTSYTTLTTIGQPVRDSVCVDAACSGNPGLMEYQCVNTANGELLFHAGPYPDGTNNVGEFLAIVHALAFLKQRDLPTKIIYTDSKIAIGWVKKKKCGTKLIETGKNEILFDLIYRAEQWLENNRYNNPILKWETKSWGEIPADFGRK